MEEFMEIKETKKLSFNKDYLKRTMWIGLAFFGILLVWQLYNSYCAPMLSFMFARHDYADKVTAGAAAGYATMKDLLAHGFTSTCSNWIQYEQPR